MNKYVQMADRLYDQEQQMKRLEEENTELKEVHESDKRSLRLIAEKGAELEKKISVLLSCKNCSENKGGYICQKEYEDKCLAQKIQFIKELQAENEELIKGLGCETCQIHLEYMSLNNRITDLEKENTELKAGRDINVFTKQLTKAKDIIRNLYAICKDNHYPNTSVLMEQAEQFLKECE